MWGFVSKTDYGPQSGFWKPEISAPGRVISESLVLINTIKSFCAMGQIKRILLNAPLTVLDQRHFENSAHYLKAGGSMPAWSKLEAKWDGMLSAWPTKRVITGAKIKPPLKAACLFTRPMSQTLASTCHRWTCLFCFFDLTLTYQSIEEEAPPPENVPDTPWQHIMCEQHRYDECVSAQCKLSQGFSVQHRLCKPRLLKDIYLVPNCCYMTHAASNKPHFLLNNRTQKRPKFSRITYCGCQPLCLYLCIHALFPWFSFGSQVTFAI